MRKRALIQIRQTGLKITPRVYKHFQTLSSRFDPRNSQHLEILDSLLTEDEREVLREIPEADDLNSMLAKLGEVVFWYLGDYARLGNRFFEFSKGELAAGDDEDETFYLKEITELRNNPDLKKLALAFGERYENHDDLRRLIFPHDFEEYSRYCEETENERYNIFISLSNQAGFTESLRQYGLIDRDRFVNWHKYWPRRRLLESFFLMVLYELTIRVNCIVRQQLATMLQRDFSADKVNVYDDEYQSYGDTIAHVPSKLANGVDIYIHADWSGITLTYDGMHRFSKAFSNSDPDNHFEVDVKECVESTKEFLRDWFADRIGFYTCAIHGSKPSWNWIRLEKDGSLPDDIESESLVVSYSRRLR